MPTPDGSALLLRPWRATLKSVSRVPDTDSPPSQAPALATLLNPRTPSSSPVSGVLTSTLFSQAVRAPNLCSALDFSLGSPRLFALKTG